MNAACAELPRPRTFTTAHWQAQLQVDKQNYSIYRVRDSSLGLRDAHRCCDLRRCWLRFVATLVSYVI